MKPWPKQFAERYPLPRGRVASRPWWFADDGDSGVPVASARRHDGRELTAWMRAFNPDGSVIEGGVVYGGRTYTQRVVWGQDCVGSRADAIAAVDKAHPLPHPGFRAGQLWGTADERGYTVVQIVEEYDAGGEGDRTHPPGRWFTLVCVGRISVTDGVLERVAWHYREDRLAKAFAGWYLIADLACPHLAPWAPADCADANPEEKAP